MTKKISLVLLVLFLCGCGRNYRERVIEAYKACDGTLNIRTRVSYWNSFMEFECLNTYIGEDK